METGAIHAEVITGKRVAVIGAGSFGLAMAVVASRNNHNVVLVARDQAQVDSINKTHHNTKYFPDFLLPDNLSATTDVREACAGCEVIITAVPAQSTPDWMAAHKDDIPRDAIVVVTAKGLYLRTKQLLHEPILASLGRDQPLAFLSGPSFAKELLSNHPSAVVVASKLLYHAVTVQRYLSNLFFRVYTSQDIIGVQLGGALKNPLAIGSGMIEGSGFGINTTSFYVTRSSLELQQLCVAMGGKPSTISGLAGVGDLMLTAFGELSRNRKCGSRFAKGEKLEDICKDYTVEGVPTAEVAVHFADKCGLETPIFRCIHGLLSSKIAMADAHGLLMGRSLSREHHHD